ncbi:MAG TPA: class D sortase [Terriglobales bacterium]|jgi:sortase A|nr:class D sortase [Terriglobales bacterium]
MNPRSQPIKVFTPWRTKFVRAVCYLFFAFGILALGYAGIVFADSHIYQDVELQNFERSTTSPVSRVLADGDVLGELQVPRLGINEIVVQGDSAADLRLAVGHLSNTVLPGEWGNVALAGHRDTLFRPLRDIRVGDQIKFKTPEHSFEYLVESIEVVGPKDVRVLKSTTGHDLTLLTCFPFHFVGPAPKRFIVHAREVDGRR